MPAISFPASPTVGQQVTVGSNVYTWDGTVWKISTSSLSLNLNSLTDVDTVTTPPTSNQVLGWNGSSWVPSTVSSVSQPFRNMIINGDFAINQRKFLKNDVVDLTAPATNTFLADRFFFYQANNLANMRVMQGYGSYGLPSGFVGGNDYTTFYTYSNPSTQANDLQFMCHRIEGQVMRNLLWGTANAKPATLSFWVRTTEAGFADQKFGICIKNAASSSPTYVTTYLVPSANTWHRISITIPGPTTGSWSGESLQGHIFWNLFTGSSYRVPAGSSNTWLSSSADSLYAASDSYNFGSSTGRNFSIYGIQFEEGSTATPFEIVPREIAMLRCQRYYYNITQAEGGATNSQEAYVGDGYVRATTTQAVLILRHPVPMMQNPSVNIIGTLTAGDFAAFNVGATINSQTNNRSNSRLIMTLASAGTAYRPISFYLQSLLNNQLEVRAEI